MTDWITWWFAYVYGLAKKQNGATTTVWYPIADTSIAELKERHANDIQDCIDELNSVKTDAAIVLNYMIAKLEEEL